MREARPSEPPGPGRRERGRRNATPMAPVPAVHGERMSYRSVFFRVLPHGLGLALGSARRADPVTRAQRRIRAARETCERVAVARRTNYSVRIRIRRPRSLPCRHRTAGSASWRGYRRSASRAGCRLPVHRPARYRSSRRSGRPSFCTRGLHSRQTLVSFKVANTTRAARKSGKNCRPKRRARRATRILPESRECFAARADWCARGP